MDLFLKELLSEFIPENKLNDVQRDNIQKIIKISKEFHQDAHIPPIHSRDDENIVVLESGHQPNFFPFSGTFKKVFLLDYISRKLTDRGQSPICFFGFADQNIATASYLYKNHIPSYNRDGCEGLGFSIKGYEWHRFNEIPKPTSDRWEAEMNKLEKHYLRYLQQIKEDPRIIRERIHRIIEISWRCYQDAKKFSDLNAYIFANICNEMITSNTLFFRYSDLQKDSIFIGTCRSLLLNISFYNQIYNDTIDRNSLDLPLTEGNQIPFWYHCDCGSNVTLFIRDSIIEGCCKHCKTSVSFPLNNFDEFLKGAYHRISMNAVARNIIFSEGMGTHIFIAGSGGGLAYGKISQEICQQLGYHLPCTIASFSRDYYLGTIQKYAMKMLMRSFDLSKEDICSQNLNLMILNRWNDLQHQIIVDTEMNFEKRRKMISIAQNLNMDINIIKRALCRPHSFIDILVHMDTEEIPRMWQMALENAIIEEQKDYLKIQWDVIYSNDKIFNITACKISEIFSKICSLDFDYDAKNIDNQSAYR